MSKYRLIEKSPGRWQCGLPGAAPMFQIQAATREAALAQIKASLEGMSKLAAAMGVGMGVPKVAKPAASARPAMSERALKAEVARLTREISELTGTTAKVPAAPRPAPHADRVSAAFTSGASNPRVTVKGNVQSFSIKGTK